MALVVWAPVDPLLGMEPKSLLSDLMVEPGQSCGIYEITDM